LKDIKNAVLSSVSASKKAEIKAWEEETATCEHTEGLSQQDTRNTSSQGTVGSCKICMQVGKFGKIWPIAVIAS
jgi:uncharacterized UBP type Zn finger protein